LEGKECFGSRQKNIEGKVVGTSCSDLSADDDDRSHRAIVRDSEAQGVCEIAGTLPQDLAKPPYAGIYGYGRRSGWDNQGKALARDLLLFMLNAILRKRS